MEEPRSYTDPNASGADRCRAVLDREGEDGFTPTTLAVAANCSKSVAFAQLKAIREGSVLAQARAAQDIAPQDDAEPHGVDVPNVAAPNVPRTPPASGVGAAIEAAIAAAAVDAGKVEGIVEEKLRRTAEQRKNAVQAMVSQAIEAAQIRPTIRVVQLNDAPEPVKITDHTHAAFEHCLSRENIYSSKAKAHIACFDAMRAALRE